MSSDQLRGDQKTAEKHATDKEARKAAALKALAGGCASLGSDIRNTYPVDYIRSEFPILERKIGDMRLAYLDSAASAFKPSIMPLVQNDFLSRHYSNIHRGVHRLSVEATSLYENARKQIARFIDAREAREVLFTRGTTESLNLLAYTLGEQIFASGKTVMISSLEHHANIVPWLRLAKKYGQQLCVIPIDDKGDLDMDFLRRELHADRIGALSFTFVSNVLGTITPAKELCSLARERGIISIVDAAQAVAHMPLSVQELGCDYLAFSGHKCYGPTGIGVLYGRAKLLEALEPWQSGGDMIESVSFDEVSFASIPQKFEAGTPPIAQAIGLSAALDFVQAQDLMQIHSWEKELTTYARNKLGEIAGLRILGNPQEQAGIISFVVAGIHPHDLGTLLDEKGVAVRVGHHCAEPLMRILGVPATVRISIAMYTKHKDIDQLCEAIAYAKEVFA